MHPLTFASTLFVSLFFIASLPGSHSDSAVVTISGKIQTTSTCAYCNTAWGTIATDKDHAKSTVVIRAIPYTGGCQNSSFPSNVTNAREFIGKTVLFQRGSCNFSEMVRAAEGAVGVLVINGDSLPPVIPYGGNVTRHNTTLCMVDNSTSRFFADPEHQGSVVSVRLYNSSSPVVDGAAGIFLALALVILYIGSMWNTEKERQHLLAGPRYQQLINANESSRATDAEEQQVLTRGKIIFFVLFASTFLMLLYFFYKYLIYVVLVMFTIFGWLSLYGIVIIELSNCWYFRIEQPAQPCAMRKLPSSTVKINGQTVSQH
eukprot:m.419478 g.419478  ORF g.419478 m.419478 type:complete len:317 (-) comp21304_c1_seq7:3515-4465(-)